MSGVKTAVLLGGLSGLLLLAGAYIGGQGGLLIWEVDEPDPGDDRVESALLDVKPFAIELLGGDRAQAGVGGSLRRILQDGR